MKYPWKPKPKLDLFTYIRFLDTHVRVSVSIDGKLNKMFAVLDDGVNMNAEMVVSGGMVKIKVEGHPRTSDPMITTTQLVNYVLSLAEGT